MTDSNEQALQTTNRKPRKKKPEPFTMENWDDERLARKHIRSSMDDIRARLKDEGIKTQFKKKRHEDGIQSYAIFYGRPEAEGKRVVFSEHDYIAIHFDPSRKLPGGRRKKKRAPKNAKK